MSKQKYMCPKCRSIDIEVEGSGFLCKSCGTYLLSSQIIYLTEPIADDTRRIRPQEQVGGTHYQLNIEPIEYIEANNLGFHEANIIKYVSRYKNKNGLEDLKKAKWYIQRLIDTYEEDDE